MTVTLWPRLRTICIEIREESNRCLNLIIVMIMMMMMMIKIMMMMIRVWCLAFHIDADHLNHLKKDNFDDDES